MADVTAVDEFELGDIVRLKVKPEIVGEVRSRHDTEPSVRVVWDDTSLEIPLRRWVDELEHVPDWWVGAHVTWRSFDSGYFERSMVEQTVAGVVIGAFGHNGQTFLACAIEGSFSPVIVNSHTVTLVTP